MKKIILIFLVFITNLFSLTLEERVSLLEKRVNELEKKLNIVGDSQKKIETNIDNGLLLKCNKLKLISYNYHYNNAGFVKSYDFKYILQNNYSKPIKYIYARIGFIDKDNTKLVEDYIKRDITIKPNEKIEVKTNYLIDNGSLAEYLKNTSKENLKVEFLPFIIQFIDGTRIKCNY